MAALANFGLLQGSPLGQLMGGSAGALAHMLGGGGSSAAGGGLPRAADLIQQAQALQLLAHLQTMLLQQAPPGGPGHLNPVGPGHPPSGPGHLLAGLEHGFLVGPGRGQAGQQQQQHPPHLFSQDMQKVKMFSFLSSS